MRLLLVNQPSPVFGGSETYLLTITTELERFGHDVAIYAPAGGPAESVARERGFQVVSDSDALPAAPDAVITQDAESCVEMAGRYPHAARVYVSHSGPYVPQIPPHVSGSYQAVVAMNDGTERHGHAISTGPRVLRLRQPVDLERFCGRGEPRPQLERLLLFGNQRNSQAHSAQLVAAACDRLGIELVRVGDDRHSLAPEMAIAEADAVVGIGRCIVEAMACQRPAFVLGETGAAGWVTPANYEMIEGRAFTCGETSMGLDVEGLCRELGRYRPEMGRHNRELALAQHSNRQHVSLLVAMIEELQPRPVAEPGALEAVARAVRVQRELMQRIGLAEGELRWLRDRNRGLETEHQRLERDNKAMRREIDAILAGRRYRIAQRLGRPIDAIRARLGNHRDRP